MSVAFYMDQHIDTAVTEGLRRRGIDVLTAFEDGAADWDDEPILERATQFGRTVYTQDDDFLLLAHQLLRDRREFAEVVYSHQLGITVGRPCVISN